MSEILNQIPGPLLQWYDSRARVLPWRSQPTPYRVWVSEIMLQQTRVEAALPYFDRFMAALPDIAALAQAPEAQLLKLWEGLGYYSRVRNLQKAARQVMEQWGGMLPQKLEDLIALPGIGEYSAGAIASIAYGQRVPAVDGNVLRVVSRLLASRENVMDPKVKRQLRQQVWDIIPAQRPGDFNQSLMELGSLVCLPNGKPLCSDCPLENLCLGNRLAIAQELPVKPPKKARRVVPRTVFVLCSQGRLLLHRRPSRGPLCGSFPGKTDTFPWSKLQKLWPKQASRSPPLPAWENTPISSAMWNGPWSAIRWNAFPFRLQRTMFGVHRSNYRNSTRCPRPSAPLPSGCT